MMKNKIEPYEIYTALMIIKTVCEESDECCSCPLKSQNSNTSCGLRDMPFTWKINDHNEYQAFKK